MRKFSLFLLLASVAVPATAGPDDHRDNRRERASKSEQSEERSQRSESRSERASARRTSGADQSQDRQYGAQRSDRAQPADQGTTERIRERVLERQQAASERSAAGDSVRRFRNRDRDGESERQSTSLQRRERQVRTIPDTQPSATQRRSGGIARAFDGRPRRDYRDGNYRRWSRNWHNDNRYDWRRWRDRNRSTFRLGFYYDPFGWNYRRWSIGSFLFPSYYSSRYHLNDPWQYRLPPAYGPYRWVRYWDDALLVNIYTGEVVEVMHNFFW